MKIEFYNNKVIIDGIVYVKQDKNKMRKILDELDKSLDEHKKRIKEFKENNKHSWFKNSV